MLPVMHITIAALNVAYALVGVIGAIAGMYCGFRVLDHLTPFDVSAQLRAGNQAVGCAVAGIFVGVGVAVGLTVGMGLN